MNLDERAGVQYDDWIGTIAADSVDDTSLEEYLGIDPDQHRVMAVHIAIYGGDQTITPYVIDAGITYDHLQREVDAGRPIEVREMPGIVFEIDHDDTNPPRPPTLPVTSATELLGLGFKRLEIILRTRHVPDGARFHTIDLDQ